MFTTELFTIANNGSSPWMDERMKMWCIHTHTGILFSHKKNAVLPFAVTWMEQQYIMLREIIKSDKDKYYMISTYSEFRKQNKGGEKRHKPKKQTLSHTEQRDGYQRGEWEDR